MWLLFEFGLWFSRYFQKIIADHKQEEDMETMLDRYEAEEKGLDRDDKR
jgi:hypothetical protein